jgi:hypothetical protein
VTASITIFHVSAFRCLLWACPQLREEPFRSAHCSRLRTLTRFLAKKCMCECVSVWGLRHTKRPFTHVIALARARTTHTCEALTCKEMQVATRISWSFDCCVVNSPSYLGVGNLFYLIYPKLQCDSMRVVNQETFYLLFKVL